MDSHEGAWRPKCLSFLRVHSIVYHIGNVSAQGISKEPPDSVQAFISITHRPGAFAWGRSFEEVEPSLPVVSILVQVILLETDT
jgi:hypothetical protein